MGSVFQCPPRSKPVREIPRAAKKMAFRIVLGLLAVSGVSLAAPYEEPAQNFSELDAEADPRIGKAINSSPAESRIDPYYNENPSYTYAYQVADQERQTYIAQTESRDGTLVQGEYSYVDPNGSLITVQYEADEDGYRETRNVQANFLTAYSGDASFGKVEAVAPKPAPKPVVYTKPAPKPVVAFKPAPPAPKAANNDDLVARIISQLTPFIKDTVSSAIEK